MADEIKIKIVVDDNQAVAGLKTTQKELAAVAATAVRTDSSLGKLTKGSTEAGQSLINLGRIAQDAPFGFIGIQNNINPLLESFQRLKIETGSTSAAFKSLGSSLVGGAGIGLAVSLATSALTLLAQNGFFSAGKEANKAAEAAKKFKDEVKGIADDAAKEQAQVLILVKALESETVSRQEKLGAIKELQSINPKYFGDLKIEEGLVIGLTSAYEKYKDAIIASIQNKIDSKKLEDVLEKINTATEQQQQAAVFAASNQKRINDLVAKGGTEYVKTLKNVQEILTNTDKLKRLEKERDEILARIAARNFEGQITLDTTKVKKAGETIDDVLAKLGREIDFLNAKELVFGVNETKAKIAAITNAIERLIRDFKVPADSTIIAKLFGDIQGTFNRFLERVPDVKVKVESSTDIKEKVEKDRKEAQANLGRNPLVVKVKPQFEPPTTADKAEEKRIQEQLAGILNAAPKFIQKKIGKLFNSGDIKPALEYAAKLKAIFDGITESAAQLNAEVFIALGKGIGDALSSGGNVFAGALEGILHIMGKFLVQLGEAAILASTLAIAMKNLFASPIGGLIAGIAAVAIGTILQSVKIPGFAGGVDNFSGGLAIVGERGPELVNLPRGSDVIPNHRLGGISGGSQQIEVVGRLVASGNSLVAVIDGARRTNSRNGQG